VRSITLAAPSESSPSSSGYLTGLCLNALLILVERGKDDQVLLRLPTGARGVGNGLVVGSLKSGKP
jgi:hypothetical protein